MIEIPTDLTTNYDACLNRKNVPDKFHGFYRKWLRYYLDFCHKYDFKPSGPESLAHFIVKLQSKNQSPVYQRQAGHAVSLYCDMLKDEAANPIGGSFGHPGSSENTGFPLKRPRE